jgi:hypothetical protein
MDSQTSARRSHLNTECTAAVAGADLATSKLLKLFADNETIDIVCTFEKAAS